MDIRTQLQFDGTWRVYQKRVLDHAEQYLDDGKVHIVAAPGSGKTTLGIELIHRLGRPCLILAPSITIRDQWLVRIKDAFLPNQEDAEALLSNNIRKPAPITAITYQALHSCMSRYKGVLVEKEESSEEEIDEEVDFADFDFFATVRKIGYGTICLDEAHHLRSEWWKALEDMMSKLSGVKLISLTATPPYDSTPQQWNRYISLCGPIDEEIVVPELVKEGSLCPHQDYVYFNVPTAEEKAVVAEFRKETAKVSDEIFSDPEFARIISSHPGLLHPGNYTESFLDNPQYLSSLLIFLNAKGIPFSKELTRMLGTNQKLPAVNMHWMEVLLQGFLYDDRESYDCDQAYVDELIAKLKAHSCIYKNKVRMVVNDGVSKLLRTSRGKISSMIAIVKAESSNLGADLRMLILTDYIKKEYVSAIGDENKPINELGVVPIFENIRRSTAGQAHLQLAVLSGTVVIVPMQAKVRLEAMMEERDLKLSFKGCGVPEYYQVSLCGSETTLASLVTELFQEGYIQVLIGTKSLLGEGWDSPCINSLILASFVGSFMLSNQMRGRAIRTMKGNPDKVSNIWHLVCMEPQESNGLIRPHTCMPEESEDFQMLQRRFEGFLGLDYEEDVIENGMLRLSFVEPPYTVANLEKINDKMLGLAANRAILKSRWESALTVLDKMEVVNEAGADREYFRPGALFANKLMLLVALIFFNIAGAAGVVPALLKNVHAGKGIGGIGLFAGMAGIVLVMLFFMLVLLLGLVNLASPYRRMKSIGKGILTALQEEGSVSLGRKRVMVEDFEKMVFFTYLEGGTEREKDVYAKCVEEFFGAVDNQRYILKAGSWGPKPSKYYCVPELFGKRKEDAELFYRHIKKCIGTYEVIYTRSAEGRKILLAARVHSFANKNERLMNRKKRVKSVFE